jgi:hypothetical protein
MELGMTTTKVEMADMPFSCDAALKEWAVAIEALGQGRLALIIRKGGIREDHNRFEVKFPEFLLFPSFEHQQSELLRPDHALALAEAINAEPAGDALTFAHFAKVHKAFPVTESAQLDALQSHHIWTQEYAEKRLRWRPRVALTAMVLRVYRLPEAKVAPLRPEYLGCKSWLPLLDRVNIDALEPAMSDDAFAAEAAAIDEAMSAATIAV